MISELWGYFRQGLITSGFSVLGLRLRLLPQLPWDEGCSAALADAIDFVPQRLEVPTTIQLAALKMSRLRNSEPFGFRV